MTAELTAEQIVTNILSSNEILSREKENFYITMPENLGDYLKDLPKDDKEPVIEPSEKTKYTFIKEGGWNF